DTNVLLNIYSYADQTQSDFFKILNAIDDKIWIPFHVGLEYQRRRLEVIKSQKETFKNINSYLDKIIKVFKNDFESLALHSRFPSLSKDTDLLKSEIEQSISRYKTIVSELNSNQACVRSHDKIRSKLNDLFHDRVGNAPLDQTWLDNLYNEGNTRYSLKIPPGFCDLKKADNKNTESFTYNGLLYQSKYGDLILWKQLLERSKDPSIKNVIFITDDKKSDWWFSINSNGLKEVGPLAELQAEIYRESEIENFHMYNSSSFLQDGKQNLNINVEDSSIDDINDHNKNNRTVLKNNFSDSLHSHAFMSYDKPDYLKEVEELIKNNLDNSDEYNPFSSVHSNR
ncbi:PIN-like domain-containing protein, partial [Vibrio azureus]